MMHSLIMTNMWWNQPLIVGQMISIVFPLPTYVYHKDGATECCWGNLWATQYGPRSTCSIQVLISCFVNYNVWTILFHEEQPNEIEKQNFTSWLFLMTMHKMKWLTCVHHFHLKNCHSKHKIDTETRTPHTLKIPGKNNEQIWTPTFTPHYLISTNRWGHLFLKQPTNSFILNTEFNPINQF